MPMLMTAVPNCLETEVDNALTALHTSFVDLIESKKETVLKTHIFRKIKQLSKKDRIGGYVFSMEREGFRAELNALLNEISAIRNKLIRGYQDCALQELETIYSALIQFQGQLLSLRKEAKEVDKRLRKSKYCNHERLFNAHTNFLRYSDMPKRRSSLSGS